MYFAFQRFALSGAHNITQVATRALLLYMGVCKGLCGCVSK